MNAEPVSSSGLDMPAARWREHAHALLKLAMELAYECKGHCDNPIHDEQIKELHALETEWAGSGHIVQHQRAPKGDVR